MEHNYLKELKEDHLRNIPVKLGKNIVNSFWEVFWRQSLQMHTRMNAPTHDRQNAMTIAQWALASGANKTQQFSSWTRASRAGAKAQVCGCLIEEKRS